MRNFLHFVVLFFICFLSAFTSVEALMVGELSCLEKLKPGEHKRIKVTLTNDKDQAELIELKQCDYACNSDGQHFFDSVGTQVRSNASWINLSTNRINLGPKEKVDVFISIDVPKQETLKGSYWSVLLIEPADAFQTIKEAKEGLSLHIKVRYAYHIVTTIGEGTPKLKILKKEFKTIDQQKLFAVSVANIGDLFLNPKLVLKLYNSQGKLEKALDGQSERLYPGSSQSYLINVQGLEGKKYTAFLMLDNGDKQLFGDTFDLVFP